MHLPLVLIKHLKCAVLKNPDICICSDWSRTKPKHSTKHIIWNRTAATTLKEKKEAKVKKNPNKQKDPPKMKPQEISIIMGISMINTVNEKKTDKSENNPATESGCESCLKSYIWYPFTETFYHK